MFQKIKLSRFTKLVVDERLYSSQTQAKQSKKMLTSSQSNGMQNFFNLCYDLKRNFNQSINLKINLKNLTFQFKFYFH